MIKAANPFRLYTDEDGLPLDNGYIYFGLANQDPETNPVSVYWDATGLIPAPQPLRTVNGYIVRGGTPANVFIGTQPYAVTIKDHAGAVVLYEPSLGADLVSSFNGRVGDVTLTRNDVTTALGSTPATSVTNVAAVRALNSTIVTAVVTQGYTTAGDGGAAAYYFDASDTTSIDNGGNIIVANDGARWKFGRAGTVNVRQFGAVGNGVADDWSALQTFANYLCVDGKRGYIPAGRYRVSKRVVFTNTCEVFGDGWKDVRDMTGPTTRDWAQAQIVGTIIYGAYTNTDADHSSIFRFEGNSPIVRDMEFEAQQNMPGPGWASLATPYAMDFFRPPFYEQGANGILLENVMVRNFREAINMHGCSRGTMRGIYGQCFGNGISVTKCYDVLRLEDVHLNWPFFSGLAAVTDYMDTNSQCIVLGRVDNPILNNIFVFGGRAGIVTYVDNTSEGGRVERMQITNIDLDNIGTGLLLKDAVTVDIANIQCYNRATLADSRGIDSVAELGGGQVPVRLSISNGDFQGSMAEAMKFGVQGNVMLSNVRVRDYNLSGGSYPGIAAYDGVNVLGGVVVFETSSTTPTTQTFGTGTININGGGGGGGSGVSSWNTRTGAVTLQPSDLTAALGLNGLPTMFRSTGHVTPTTGVGLEMSYDPSTSGSYLISYNRGTSQYADINLGGNNINFKSGLAGPVVGAFDTNGFLLLGYGSSQGSYKLQVNGQAIFGSAVFGPTAAFGTNTTQLATTAFVQSAVTGGPAGSDFASTVRSTATTNPASGKGVEVNYDPVGTDAGFVNSYDRTAGAYKNLNVGGLSITFKTGSTGVNSAAFDSSGQLLIAYGTSQGAYKLQVNGDIYCGAAIYSATPATSTTGTRVATCDYVINRISTNGVSSFNSRNGAVTLNSSDVSGAQGYTSANRAGDTFTGNVNVSGNIRSTSFTAPASGAGLEINYDGTTGYVNAYDRSASQYVPVNLGGSTITFKAGTSGTNVAFFDTLGSLMIGYGTSQGAAYKLQVNSQIFATSATIATSDERVKENITDLQDGLGAIQRLRPVAYDFIPHGVHNFPKARQIGFLAQQLERALDGEDYLGAVVSQPDDPDGLKGVAEAKLIPLLVRAVQQLAARVETLEAIIVP